MNPMSPVFTTLAAAKHQKNDFKIVAQIFSCISV